LSRGTEFEIIIGVKWTDQSKIAAIRKTSLFGVVPEADLERLLSDVTLLHLGRQEVLFTCGDPCKGLFIVLEGRTRAIRHGVDGREQVIHEDAPFSTFPEVSVFDDGPYPSTVIAAERSVLLFLPKTTIREFCLQHPEVAMSALRVLSGRLRRATGMVEYLSLKEVSQRLAEFLLRQIRYRPEGQRHLELKHSNQEIADMIGTVREVVSRAFTKLQRKSWIKKRGRSIEVLDREALEEHALGPGRV